MTRKSLFAALAAFVALVSCQKDVDLDILSADIPTSPVFTAFINPGTKTSVDVSNGKVSWENGDEITVTDASSQSAVYQVQSIDSESGMAVFVIKPGDSVLGDGPYSAVYGCEPSTSQTYSDNVGQLYMTASESSDNVFTFTVQCGIMKLNLTRNGEKVSKITVTGVPVNATGTIYSLVCESPQDITEARNFCLALPAGNYSKIEITNASGCVCTLNAASGVVVNANSIKPVTIKENKINFVPAGSLKGKFTVDSDGSKVCFSRGNLFYNGSSFDFETQQYDFPYSWNDSHVGHFYWDKSSSDAVAQYFIYSGKTADDVFFTNATETSAETQFTVAGVKGLYRTLSSAEWGYLLGSSTERLGRNKFGVCVQDFGNCLVIVPDDWDLDANPLQKEYDSSSSPMTWEQAEAAGMVCLPASGSRTGTNISYYSSCFDDGEGYYWSSSTIGADFASYLSFKSFPYNGMSTGSRSCGYPLRLVTDSE